MTYYNWRIRLTSKARGAYSWYDTVVFCVSPMFLLFTAFSFTKQPEVSLLMFGSYFSPGRKSINTIAPFGEMWLWSIGTLHVRESGKKKNLVQTARKCLVCCYWFFCLFPHNNLTPLVWFHNKETCYVILYRNEGTMKILKTIQVPN